MKIPFEGTKPFRGVSLENMESNRNVAVYAIRHGIASEVAVNIALQGENPHIRISKEDDLMDVLTEEGVVHAEGEARKLFSKFNSGDLVPIFTSKINRARQTAEIYERILTTEFPSLQLLPIRGQNINDVNILTFRPNSPLVYDLFEPVDFIKDGVVYPYNFTVAGREYERAWREARTFLKQEAQKDAEISVNEKGETEYGKGWRANIIKYSRTLKEKWPILEIDDYETWIKNQTHVLLTRRLPIIMNELGKLHPDKIIRALTFVHGGYTDILGETYTKETGIPKGQMKNAEAVEFIKNEKGEVEYRYVQ